MPKFSIVTPITYDKEDADNERMPRYEMFLRCAKSVQSQTFKDFEWIVADDMSNPPVEDVLKDNFPDIRKKVFRLPEKSGRIVARNTGMENSKGDWICWLDGDDEYASWYLEAMNDAVRLYPDYKVFNFNHLIVNYNYEMNIRPFINMEIQGDTPFRSGVIGAGAFIFHRDVYEEVGPIPELNVWDLAYKAFEEFPEIKPFYWNEGNKDYDSLGNPWGDDYYYFYKMTRKNPSKYLNTAPYYVHSRWGHRWAIDPDYQVDPGAKPSWNPKNK